MLACASEILTAVQDKLHFVSRLKIHENFFYFRKSIKDREKVAKGLKKHRISKWKEFKMQVAMVSNVSKVKSRVNSFLDSVLIQGLQTKILLVYVGSLKDLISRK